MDTLEEVKLLLKELVISQKETDLKFRETDLKFKETDLKFQETDSELKETSRLVKELTHNIYGIADSKETDRKFQETDNELKETSRLVKELTRNINGMADSNGLTAEQFFSSALEHSPSLNGVSFDYAERNEKRYNKQRTLREQYDVVLYSESEVGIVEIKYRVRSNDIELLASRKVENFRLLFPQEATKDIYLAVAGFSVDDHAIEKARELGVFVMTQVGERIKLLNDKARIY